MVLAPCDGECDVWVSPIVQSYFRESVGREDQPAVVIFNSDRGPLSYYYRLVYAAWRDGEVVWSDNTVRGGAPYRRGHVPVDQLARTLREAAGEQLLMHPSVEEYAIPDNMSPPKTSIVICFGEYCVQRTASFEVFESTQHLVTANGGWALLKDEQNWREELAREPAGYLEFRQVWAKARRTIIYDAVQAAEEVEVIPGQHAIE